jgi:hypothetical protein
MLQLRIGCSDDAAAELAKLLRDTADVERILQDCTVRDACRLEQLFDASVNNTSPICVCEALGVSLLEFPWPETHKLELTWKVSSILSDIQCRAVDLEGVIHTVTYPWTSLAAQALVNMWSATVPDVSAVRHAILKHVMALLKDVSVKRLQPFRESSFLLTPPHEDIGISRSVLMELARRGRLGSEDVHGCSMTELRGIATQLKEESKLTAAATVAFLVAERAEAAGDLVDAAHMFVYGYGLDRSHSGITEGVLRTAPALSQRCKELQSCQDSVRCTDDPYTENCGGRALNFKVLSV